MIDQICLATYMSWALVASGTGATSASSCFSTQIACEQARADARADAICIPQPPVGQNNLAATNGPVLTGNGTVSAWFPACPEGYTIVQSTGLRPKCAVTSTLIDAK